MKLQRNIAFISGHIDISDAEFDKHYKPSIDAAIKSGDVFMIGDANGVDAKAQEYLANKGFDKVVVTHMFNSPRNNVGNFKTVGQFKSDVERDTYMTKNSDYDIAWVREGRENSGTANNLKRRKRIHG